MTEMTEMTDNVTEEIVLDLNEDKKEEKIRELSALKKEEDIKQEPKIIPAKRIDELTDEERKILIENERAGIKNPYYNVKLFKNGNVRICKAKKPTLSQQVISNNGEREIRNTNGDNRKVYMTDSQLMWEHIFELENKYNTLYTKHKKLKAKYNDLYIEDDDLISRQMPTYEQQQQEEQQKEEPVYEQQQEPVYEEQPQQLQQPAYQNIKRNNWRSMLLNR
jgi:hypothetical protein